MVRSEILKNIELLIFFSVKNSLYKSMACMRILLLRFFSAKLSIAFARPNLASGHDGFVKVKAVKRL